MNTLLITGANRGIGLEMVKQYATDGWRVFACCRCPEQADALQSLKQTHPLIHICPLDVREPDAIRQLAQQLSHEPIDLLVNNAGVWGSAVQGFGETDPVAWLEAFKVNAIAPQLLAESFVDHIAQSQLKRMANVSSEMGSITLNTFGGFAMYRSTKAALNAVTRSLAIDLKAKQITVIALHPGWVKTDMGGPQAKITVTESVNGLKTILNQLSIQDSGQFMGYDGKPLLW